ncbi:CP2-domain-containing protein [Basidiobolus meristosporus CBS 931.73]|uniref:CP2-domain-containing protein n=1 Tax=Basidiobolus meristosporus CBS 931.73 TaxID=1314790 RepID=A0A1Y1ZCN1_9FUNG|nr:CP2-domain-containing protein [Basidiobolus meristosporus CBS 931.73]|eukprot:ORY07737.1 CP2-domain-containing protein [Basidiobolus meristosporus CBS 931.73]
MQPSAPYGGFHPQQFQGIDSRQSLPQFKQEPLFPDNHSHQLLSHQSVLNHQLPSVASSHFLPHGQSIPQFNTHHNTNTHPNEMPVPHQMQAHHYQHQSHLETSQQNHDAHFGLNAGVAVTSPANAALPSNPNSNLRFEVVLEAQTAAAQRLDENPLTYLNKGQYYPIALNDNARDDAELTSTLRVMFHDDAHRKLANTYWQFWLSQQPNPKTARAVDIDKAASTGIKNVECSSLDRITFQWNGRKGAKIYIKFNCLSTDFSRIKGVKGIPLRARMETAPDMNPASNEKSFAKVKLFRDKGAERKNKDDQRHLEKIWEKMRGKQQDSNPLLMMFAQASPVTSFIEWSSNDLSDAEEDPSNIDVDTIDPENAELDPAVLAATKKRRLESLGHDLDLLELDPTYVPSRKKRSGNAMALLWNLPYQQANCYDLPLHQFCRCLYGLPERTSTELYT